MVTVHYGLWAKSMQLSPLNVLLATKIRHNFTGTVFCELEFIAVLGALNVAKNENFTIAIHAKFTILWQIDFASLGLLRN